MDTIVKCCAILHNMIVLELWPLDCVDPNATGHVKVGEDAEYCFERLC